MKKTLVSALTTALVVGAASTTFAAANPFEDVPADHWAYDAVAQLAKDGVVEGYGDGTYVGDAAITRYEMAQMVAKAMTKSDLKHADKAMVDKLAAEFADELNNLGVRVAKLEKKIDNVKYDGILRYTWNNTRIDGNSQHGNGNDWRLRLSMHSEINENWTGHARMEYITNMDDAKNCKQVLVNRLWAEGQYGNTNIQLGKFPYYTMVDDGMIFDDDFAGGQVTFGKDVKVKVVAGRYSNTSAGIFTNAETGLDKTVSMQGIEVYSKAKKFTWGASYHNVVDKQLFDKNMGVWAIGLGYKFNKDWGIKAAYAQSNADNYTTKDNNWGKKAYSIEVDFKEADMNKPGTWGAFIAYRHLGQYAAIAPTYNSIFNSVKGWHVGAKVAMMKNVLGYLEYFYGKRIGDGVNAEGAWTDGTKTRTIFGRVEMYF